MDKFLIIINPRAGAGKPLTRVKAIEKFFRCRCLDYVIEYTRYPKDAATIAARYENSDYNYYLVCGGDGTLSEVINGLPCYSNKILLFLPAGTVNIFAKEFNIPQQVDLALAQLLSGAVVTLDVGLSNGNKFLLLLGAGIDGFIVSKISIRMKKLRHLAYFLTFVQCLFSYPFPPITITTDTLAEVGYYVLVSKCRYYGGLFNITPAARMDNGLFDVCVLKKKGILALLKFIILVIFQKQQQCQDVHFYRTSKLVLTGPGIVSQTDGDRSDPLPLEIELTARTCKFLVPKPATVPPNECR